MKQYIELKKCSLPTHKEEGFFKTLTAQAKEHGYSGFLYRIRYFFYKLFNYHFQLVSRIVSSSAFRVKLQRARGVKIGNNTHFGPRVAIDDIYPNYAIIGNDVLLAGENLILTHNKPLYHINVVEAFVAPTIIEDNACIDVGVIILPGVIIGEGSIVAAGAVVSRDIPPLVLAAGAPAKPINDLADKLKYHYSKDKFDILMKRRKEMGYEGNK